MTMASVGQKLIAFVYFLFLARVMMPERTGVFFLATSIITLFSIFTDLGLTAVTIREIAKRPENREQTVQNVVGLKLLLMAISVVIVFFASILLHYDTQITELIWITMTVMILDAFALLLYGILRGFQQLRYEATGILISQCVTVMVGGISLIVHPDVRFLVLALILGSLTNLLIALSQVIRLYGFHMLVPKWNNRLVWGVLKVMAPFALAGIFTKVYSTIDVVLISKLLNTTAVGIYSVAYKFTYAFQFLPLALSAALYPSLSSTVEHDQEATAKTFFRAIWYIFLIATPIVFGVWLVAPQMIRLTGHGFDDSIVILGTLLFVLFPSFLEIPFGSLLNASDRQSLRMKILGTAMITNIVLDVLMIPHLGLMGAVIGSLVSYTFMITLEVWFVSRILPHFFRHVASHRIFQILLSGIIMFGVGILLIQKIPWLIVIPCVALVYLFALFLTHAILKSDVVSVRSLFKKTPPLV